MDKIIELKREVRNELLSDILPYWLRLQDNLWGGFYGEITGEEVLNPEADKGAIQQCRILWTFSAAYRILRDEVYLDAATHALRFIIDHLYDKVHGGIFWSVNHKGEPTDTKKQIYALGFAIYGLSEYYRACKNDEALEYAIRLFNDIEKYSFDIEKNGYFEAFSREWGLMEDMRLSEKDENECKTMNTHLHILEPYTNLYRVWKDERLKTQLRNLIQLFLSKILNPETKHLQLFFDSDWNSKHNIISYGHDIEASWLIHEAALELGDKDILNEVTPKIKCIAEAASEGFSQNNGMIYEKNTDSGHIDEERHWWVQAEAVVGYANLYQHFEDDFALMKAADCWEFIKEHLLDRKNGEWYWSIKANGKVNHKDDKAGFWKCPYHNGRMCMEIVERFNY